ncbi:MAG: hypothetical protein ACRDNS_34485, partial [Trebonia sp.]
MTAAAGAARARRADPSPPTTIEVIRSLIDWPALQALGWDPTRNVFAPHADDPVLGLATCRVIGCDDGCATTRWRLCYRCLRRWRRASSDTTIEEFCATTAPGGSNRGGPELCLLCRTPGQERPQHWQGLCGACAAVMSQRGQSVTDYLEGDGEFPPARPRSSFGKCGVVACERWAEHGEPTLCASHYRRWTDGSRPRAAAFRRWCVAQTAFGADRRVVRLDGLSERARLEVLYGLQCRAQAERRTTPPIVQMVANLMQGQHVDSVFDLSMGAIADERRLFVLFVRDRLSLAIARPDTEKVKDIWDLRVFGRRGGRM